MEKAWEEEQRQKRQSEVRHLFPKDEVPECSILTQPLSYRTQRLMNDLVHDLINEQSGSSKHNIAGHFTHSLTSQHCHQADDDAAKASLRDELELAPTLFEGEALIPHSSLSDYG